MSGLTNGEEHLNTWQRFTALGWYDGLIEFLFRFVAKTSADTWMKRLQVPQPEGNNERSERP